KVQETWKKLRTPILRTFRLAQQPTTFAQASRKSQFLNESKIFLKVATSYPGIIRNQELKKLKNPKSRNESVLTIFTRGGGEAGPLSHANRERRSYITLITSERLKVSEIRKERRRNNEIMRSMGSNRSRKTSGDGNYATVIQRKQQTNPLKHITSHRSQTKITPISSSTL
ncbi:MAG: hypothetical protein EZS28_005312, partial [Streblomastix strix]